MRNRMKLFATLSLIPTLLGGCATFRQSDFNTHEGASREVASSFPPFIQKAEVPEPPLPRSGRHILVIGDSQVVMGCSRESAADRNTGKCGWRKNLAREARIPESELQIDTVAQVGLRAATLHKTFPTSLAGADTSFITRRQYDLVILQIGGNDVGDGSGEAASKAETITQLAHSIVGAVRARKYALLSVSPRCVYLGAPQDVSKGRRVGRQAFEVNQILKARFSSGAPVEFVYLYDRVVSPPVNASDPEFTGCLRPEYASGDQVHPSESGRAAVGRAVAQALF